MKHFVFKRQCKIHFSLVMIFFILILAEGLGVNSADREENQEQEAKRAKLYRDVFPLISESDLYCSFFVIEDEELGIEIIDSERESERVLIREHDIFYINKGRMDGLEPGQIFLILEIGHQVKNPVTGKKFGYLAFKRGRALIVAAEETQASAKLEKACGKVMVGYFLVPFEEKGGLLGKDLGYDVPLQEMEGPQGMVIYVVRDYEQIGREAWAVIDLGEDDGIQFGQQLVIYKGTKEEGSLKTIGNLIVIDAQRKTSTVKILSCNDVVKVGNRVQPHFK